MTNKEIFTMFRRVFGFEKSKEYLAWAKELFPNYDLHHILSSTFGKKFTDFLVIPLTHAEHLNIAEKHKADYCIKHYQTSVNLFLRYAKEKGIVDQVFSLPVDAETGLYEAHKVAELIKTIK